MKEITRRTFAWRTAAGLAGGLVALRAPAQMGGGGPGGSGGGTSVIDPLPGMIFREPLEMPNLSNVPGLIEVLIEPRPAVVNVHGTMANLLTYNGSFPGPTIRARRGDRLKVHFRNSIPNLGTNLLGHVRSATNLHTHGLHVSPSGNSDNSMLMIPPGGTLD